MHVQLQKQQDKILKMNQLGVYVEWYQKATKIHLNYKKIKIYYNMKDVFHG